MTSGHALPSFGLGQYLLPDQVVARGSAVILVLIHISGRYTLTHSSQALLDCPMQRLVVEAATDASCQNKLEASQDGVLISVAGGLARGRVIEPCRAGISVRGCTVGFFGFWGPPVRR